MSRAVLVPSLLSLPAVEEVTVFDAIAFAPPSAYVKEQGETVQRAHYDLVVLIETTEPASARQVQHSGAYQALVEVLESQARKMHSIAAQNVKRIGEVVKQRKSLFLFNYFVGEDRAVSLALWDYLADWYQVETGLATSVLLKPLEGEPSAYHLINYASWDASLLRFLWRQMSKKSFREYLLANLKANQVGAMPVVYRLA